MVSKIALYLHSKLNEMRTVCWIPIVGIFLMSDKEHEENLANNQSNYNCWEYYQYMMTAMIVSILCLSTNK